MSEQLDYVAAKVKEQIDYFLEKRTRNKRMTVRFVIASASLSMVATVAIGASKSLDVKWLTLVALITSGSSTVVAACEALLSYRQQWTINNLALVPLYELKREIAYRQLEPRPIEKEEADKFFSEFQKITKAAYIEWATLHSRGVGLPVK